jgi:protein SCO1/2
MELKEKSCLNLKVICKALFIISVLSLAHGAFAHEEADSHTNHDIVAQKIKTTMADYSLPQVKLVRADGKTVSLPDELNDSRPVIMNFIYTTCKATCPLSSQIFSQLQRKLGDERKKVHMVSISIDPEQDTPSRLTDYAFKYNAGTQWQLYTGAIEASLAAQRAFDVYRGDKMNHIPVTLLRAANGKRWLRIDGFASADDVLQEYRKLIAVP